ncbi:MAG TPA: hypothetical protein VER11_20205 [Polyangiaceae bacterium]|nr:hypothetical protein [Polyangiaceae bacterium]
MTCVQRLRSFAYCSLALVVTTACGGTALSGSGGEGNSGGAGTGTAGTGTAGTGTAGTGTAGTGNSGGSSGGGSGGSCVYQGKSYPAGSTFPASDGCNACSCQSSGAIYCTTRACANDCSAINAEYAGVLEKAKACDPSQTGQCTAVALGNLPCGCSTPVNAENQEAIAQLESLRMQADGTCSAVCSPCLPPHPGTCTASGRCEEAPLRASASCKVGGVVYPSGTSGIQDPTSCNKCSCENGELTCTEIGCPTPCPAGTQFGSQCAQCGPTDACEVFEYACLPTCTDSCPPGVCSNGICRQACG